MRIAVTGATGNVGTSLIRALSHEPRVDTVLGIARRVPEIRLPKTTWVQADVVHSDLTELFRGADAVVHLAWLIQPSRDKGATEAANVEGSARVFHAVGAAGVPRLVYASSVGAYSPGPKDRRVDETWPTDGIEGSYYSLQKAQVERRLDRFEAEAPDVRVVRLRPGLIFKRDAAAGIRRLFAGPFLPNRLVRPGLIPLVPDTERLVFQAVHSYDVGEAYRIAVVDDDARGAYNIAAEPVLDPSRIAALLKARTVRVPRRVLRGAADLTWRLRLHPAEASWLDLAFCTPIMDVTRAREELGWAPRRGADDALADLLEGIREGAGYGTPPLARGTGGPLRIRELLTGVGRRVGMT
jgi:nucleoside-diphosphate-sugar epimerase